MNKKTLKILVTILTIILILAMATTVFAAAGFGPSDISGSSPSGASSIQKFGNQIVGVLQAIGVIVSVAILVVIGIKYMLGSAEEKAEYKKTMLPYIVGAALVFAASMIAGIVTNFFTSAS